MQPHRLVMRFAAAAVFWILGATVCSGQSSPTIQFFMPDGSLPPRELRFTMAVDNGRIETYFTDSKGKFLLTRLLGLRSDSEYRVTVVGDGLTFETTSVTFKEYGVYYIPVYLRPLKSAPTRPAGVVDVAELDVQVPEEARQAYSAGIRDYAAGKSTDAVQQLRRALSIHPNYFRALNDLGVILMKEGDLDGAAAMFERATKIGPRVYLPRLNLAVIKTRKAKYAEAISSLEQLCKEAPALTEARVALADALMATGRLDEAEKHLRTALSDPKLEREKAGDVHYKLGSLLNRKQKFEAAVVELSTAREIMPGSPRTRLQLGAALLQVNRMDEAERELLAAYKIGGAEMGGAQLMLGEIYFRQKKYETAMRCFEQYLTDVPSAPNSVEVRGVIERIKTSLGRK